MWWSSSFDCGELWNIAQRPAQGSESQDKGVGETTAHLRGAQIETGIRFRGRKGRSMTHFVHLTLRVNNARVIMYWYHLYVHTAYILGYIQAHTMLNTTVRSRSCERLKPSCARWRCRRRRCARTASSSCSSLRRSPSTATPMVVDHSEYIHLW